MCRPTWSGIYVVSNLHVFITIGSTLCIYSGIYMVGIYSVGDLLSWGSTLQLLFRDLHGIYMVGDLHGQKHGESTWSGINMVGIYSGIYIWGSTHEGIFRWGSARSGINMVEIYLVRNLHGGGSIRSGIYMWRSTWSGIYLVVTYFVKDLHDMGYTWPGYNMCGIYMTRDQHGGDLLGQGSILSGIYMWRSTRSGNNMCQSTQFGIYLVWIYNPTVWGNLLGKRST